MTTAYIGIGTNVNREASIEAAIFALQEIADSVRLSTVYECASVGFESSPFYNLVAEVSTSASYEHFQKQLRDIELELGRPAAAQKFQDRTIDLDIILFGERTSTVEPKLPRDDIYKYPFVTLPLSELCPDKIIPSDGRTVRQLQQLVQGEETLRAVELWFESIPVAV